ncbi:MAG TPA: hypothetical protein DIU39_03260 [Flavobacteriales bacterium]|nr:hypothetical protein [Flavobacteriales bacterium]|tara:strand:- start:33451 stop:34323 length:873 start_codon:yes stop_codon:yes gene_type:complete
MHPNEIKALLNLLDDPDENIYHEVRNRFLELGNEVIPYLENLWETSYEPIIQERVESIIHELQIRQTKKKLKDWLESSDKSLVKGALAFANYQYPDIEEDEIFKTLQAITKDVWVELNPNQTALEKVKIINHILFNTYKFSSDKKDIYNPKNFFINKVFELKKGNPITLGIIYLEICSRLNIPVYGVNLPRHFVLAYTNRQQLFEDKPEFTQEDILFYINPFFRGFVFQKEEIDKYLKQLNIEPKPEYYLPCSNTTIIYTLIDELKNVYDKMGEKEKVEELNDILALFNL